MAEEESDVFEITDFTTASEWERFIARIEEVIHEWRLNKQYTSQPLKRGDFSGTWIDKTEIITFADFKFNVTRHYLKSQEQEVDIPEDDQNETVPTVLQDVVSMENDFPSRAHCISRWYGLRDFVIMSPAAQNEAIMAESRSNLVLSSIAIALNNTGCHIPLFVQVHEKWRRLYFGLSEYPGLRTNFEMVHLKHIPPAYNHLSGLIDMFKAKLNCSSLSASSPVQVSIRFTFVLQDWPHYSWTQVPPDFDAGSGTNVGMTDLETLPFGACQDPVSELHLAATWPSISEEMVVDNANYSDLDPLQAPVWSVRLKLTDDPQCLMGEYLRDFLRLCRRKESLDQLLPNFSLDDSETELPATQALDKLTKPAMGYKLSSMTSISNAVSKASTRLKHQTTEEAPIRGELLNKILLFLFPDAQVETADLPLVVPVAEGEENKNTAIETEIKHLLHQLKSAPVESVTHKLAVCMCLVHHSYGGLKAVAHLWQEFVLEMRYRWENNYYIPLLDKSIPNMGCSLIHQKLQMLNCCIERKVKREAKLAEVNSGILHASASTSSINTGKPGDMDYIETSNVTEETNNVAMETDNITMETAVQSDAESSTDDEEFFECNENSSETSTKSNQSKQSDFKTINESSTSQNKNSDSDAASESDIPEKISESSNPSSQIPPTKTPISPIKPDGRLRQCGDLLILDTEIPLYIPVTQEPAPMTEDMLEQHAEVLTKLGSTSEGSHLRAKMQSTCLLSDMESFKAANPGCTLKDFVRWYSPRDWIEEKETQTDGSIIIIGQLSARMQIANNMWLEVWASAKPIPAHRQKRLFDDTKEAEKVLHFLAALKPADAAIHLLPMLMHAAILRLCKTDEIPTPSLVKILTQATTKAARITRDSSSSLRSYEEVVQHISLAETFVARGESIRCKFKQEVTSSESSEIQTTREKFIRSLLELPEVPVIGAARGPEGKIIHKLFAEAEKASNDLDVDVAPSLENQPPSGGDFPKPAGREYILRTEVPRPAPYSKPSPQRLHCTLLNNEFRLAGAFTEDTTFQ
ncbi:unnamed protein product [Owenia fusiformis]|uniref:Rab3 GTPase-activating protein catalytic subunit n=1 Tax=Owenia fusiformis TaxID=6347 RepID=A0A8J1UUP1_OWEFU|nr:unnamed protein product [Owenia fusiformis]